MQILVLNQYFAPDIASTGQILTELCEDLAGTHDVTVVCGRPSYNPAAEQPRARGRLVTRSQHANILVLRTWSTGFSRRNLLGRLTNYATYMVSCLWGGMVAPRPDVIVTMTDPPLVALVAFLVSRLRRAPFVYVCQDVIPQNALAVGQLRPGRLSRLVARLNHFLRARAAVVVAIGRDMRDRLVELGTPPERVHVIPNWADGATIRPLDGPSPLRDAQGWQDRFVVMHSGNLGRAQGLEMLIECADRMRDDPDVVFAIVGDGVARERLEDLARTKGLENVAFLPYQPKTELSASLGAADVHVIGWHPGLAGYALPSKLYGVMAVGKPFVVAIEEGSEPALVVAEEGCGLRVDPGDAEALVDALRQLRTLDRDAMGRAGRAALEARFDRPIATAAYRTLLESAAR